jgi:negative regulator of sigma E activity
MLRLIIPPCEDARKKGDLQLEYLGMREEGGRPAYVFKRTLPAEKGYPCHLLTVYIDQQFMIPIRTDAFNWDGNLQGHYRYMDINVNPPLTDDDFNPDKRF